MHSNIMALSTLKCPKILLPTILAQNIIPPPQCYLLSYTENFHEALNLLTIYLMQFKKKKKNYCYKIPTYKFLFVIFKWQFDFMPLTNVQPFYCLYSQLQINSCWSINFSKISFHNILEVSYFLLFLICWCLQSLFSQLFDTLQNWILIINLTISSFGGVISFS